MNALILLIDDNAEILEFIEDSLVKDYDIIKTQDPSKADFILKRNPISLIISDVMMPVMDGFELCKRLKASTQWNHIPLILLTAKNTLLSKIEGLEIGADAYVEKPFSPRHLKAQIASLLTNRTMIKAYFSRSPLIHFKSIANNREDELFMERLNQVIIENMENSDLHSEHLAEALFISKPTLYRKIRLITEVSLVELITVARLKKAAELLASGEYRISEVSNITGFSSPNHFSRTFLKQFKMSPTTFIKSL